MSIEYNIKIGPYIQVFSPKIDSIKKLSHTCPNTKCSNHGVDKASSNRDLFCSQCGNKFIPLEIPCKKQIYFDVYEETNNHLGEAFREYKPTEREDFRFFISNKLPVIGYDIDPNYETCAIEIYLEEPTHEIEMFKKRYNEYIEEIENIFGKDKVKIKWGVLCYSS